MKMKRRPRAERAATLAQDSSIVFYRCPSPTNFLCPCGAVERRLKRLQLSHRVERVPYKRSARPEIEELTRQRRVPVLVDGDEIVHDSKRISEYVEWKYGTGLDAREQADSRDS